MKCFICENNVTILLADTLRDGSKRNVFFCDTCDLGILDNQKTQEEIRQYYRHVYRSDSPEKLFADFFPFQHDRLRLLKPYLNNKVKLLEVGCSAGMFLNHIKGKVKEIVGLDYDTKSAKFTEEICHCKVLGSENQLPKNYFDIICIFQTLEHVFNPYEYLQIIIKALKRDGILYIEVPNLYDSLISTYDIPSHRKFFFHQAHLWYFSEKSLMLLMTKLEFLGKIKFIQDYNVLNHLAWVNTGVLQDYIAGRALPNLPLKKSNEINTFFIKVDKEYKQLLSKLKITSNLHYIGKKT
jgi:SAM-dependent methyltransferase